MPYAIPNRGIHLDLKGAPLPRDIRDYLASRRRVGLDFLRPILESK